MYINKITDNFKTIDIYEKSYIPAKAPWLDPLKESFVLTSALAPFSPTENGLYKYCSTADTFSGTPLLTFDSTFRTD